MVRTWDFIHVPNFIEIIYGIGPLWADLCQNFHIMTILVDLSPYFSSHNGEISRQGVDLGSPSHKDL